MKILTNSNSVYYICLSCIAIVFWLCNHYTPYTVDEYLYSFYFGADTSATDPPTVKLNSIRELFESQLNHYLNINGRFTSHVLVQLFCGVLGKHWFDISNTVIFIIFLHTLLKNVPLNYRFLGLSLSWLFILTLFPSPGESLFWLAGSVNYLWTMTFTLIILQYIIQSRPKKKTIFCKHVLFFLSGLCVGWMNESITAGVAGGLFFYFLCNRSQWKGYVPPLYIGYLLGALAIVFAPGTLNRAERMGTFQSEMNVGNLIVDHLWITSIQYIKALIPLLPIVCIGFRRKDWFRSPWFFIYGCMTIFLCLIGMNRERMYFGVTVISTIILLETSVHYLNRLSNKTIKIASFLLFVGCFYPSGMAVSQIYIYKKTIKDVIVSKIETSPSQCVLDESPAYPSRFVYYPPITTNPNNYYNKVYSHYFQKRTVQELPHSLYLHYDQKDFLARSTKTDFYCNDTTSAISIYQLTDAPFWVIPLNQEKIAELTAEAIYTYALPEHQEKLKPHQKFIRTLLGSIHPTVQKKIPVFPLCHPSGTFLILPAENQVKEINFTLPASSTSGTVQLKFNRSSDKS